MKRILTGLSFLIFPACCCLSQDAAKSINKIKRDTMYIYAEATMKELGEAANGARAILEMKVGEWVRDRHPSVGAAQCLAKAKEHYRQIETRRGDMYRIFVYVSKGDILPGGQPVGQPAGSSAAPSAGPSASPSSGSSTGPSAGPSVAVKSKVEVLEMPPAAKAPTQSIELTQEEKQMALIRSFYDIEPYIKRLQNNGKLQKYGKYASMPETGDLHLFVYDKQGNIAALLRRSGNVQYNLNTLKEDNVKNYKNCGAVWFQLK